MYTGLGGWLLRLAAAIWPRAKLRTRLTPADFAGRRRRTPQDLGRILAGPGIGVFRTRSTAPSPHSTGGFRRAATKNAKTLTQIHIF